MQAYRNLPPTEEEGLLKWHGTSGKLSATMMGHALHKLGKT